ncbi:MAG: O-antigen ligase family protein [Lutibacter sp.]|jgi:O-antigen ligase/tetratricopeptide (TPR) repeat protein
MKNNTINIKKNIDKILFWFISFILFLPIIILPPSFQPSEWSRTILFRSTITILVGFLLYKYFYKNDIFVSLPKWKISNYLPFLTLSAFILLVAISTIFSQDPRFSFFSSPARAGGSLNMLFYFIFAMILAIFVKNKSWDKLWKINFIVATLASLLAIIQSFNIFKNTFVSYEGGGVPSFLGNSTFLAIYIFFMIIWSSILFIQKKEKKQKMIYGGLFLLFALTIFLTGSRATYLAILISFSFIFFFYPIKIKKIKTLKIIAGSILISAVITILIFNSFPQLSEKNEIFSRLSNRLSIERVAKDLFGTRFAVWKIAIQTIKDRPLLGWGPENFYIGFEKYYEPTISNMQKLWWDKPHNIFLDIATNFGLIALFFYISFYITLFRGLQKLKSVKKNITDNTETLQVHGLQAIFIGYLTILFFNFDSFPTYIINFFFIGYSFYLLSSEKETVEIKNRQKIINNKNKKFLAIIFIFILSLFLFFWNIKPFYINRKIESAINLSNTKNCNEAVTIIEEVNKNPDILEVYNALIYSDTIKKCSTTEKEVEYANNGLKYLKKASTIQPTWSRTWLFMGGLTDVLAAREENKENKNQLLEEAKKYLNKALKLSPKRQEIIIEMEKNSLIAEDYRAMQKIANDCINIDSGQGICYWYLGVAEIFLGDQKSGKMHIQEALDKGGFSPQYIQLGAAYLNQKNYKDAADAYHQLVVSYPNNAGYHAIMAMLSKEIGDYDRAIAEALKVFQLQPNNEESIQFLQLLLGLSPNNPLAHTSIAFVYKELGEKEKYTSELTIAKNIYIQLAKANPNIPDYHYRLAIIYAEQNDYEKSYQESLLAIKIAGPSDLKTKETLESFIQNALPVEFWNNYIKN